MLFAIHAIDKKGALQTRLDNYDAHKSFLSNTEPHRVRIVMSGPLVAEDGATMIGSLLVVEAASLADVTAFNKADPFFAAGIWDHVSVTGFVRRQG
jgi:uncharacterized protein YciI